MQTHFYNYEEFANPAADFDYEIRFDTIAGDNADKTPLLDQVTTKTYDRFDTSNTLYILTAREGATLDENGDENHITTFADSTFVTYRGANILGEVFDAASNPIWFNLPATIDGFSNGIAGFTGGTGFTIADDGTSVYAPDYGIGAVFIPSGLGYFAQPPNSNIGIYSSLVFTFSVFDSKETDHDSDGIISINEDLDGNNFFFDDIDDTDEDTAPNFNDPDDDNDGVTTSLEIILTTVTIINDEGEEEEVEVFESFKDTDNDGTNDHLDTDDDGDGIPTLDEININFNTGVITYPDTDEDGIADYLDSDS
ncbi:MAG: FKBP-type peptidyl-prolyl cis-trans isomerase FkpA [Dokdonia sp.]